MKKKFITPDQAKELLPKGKYIHTFYNEPFGLLVGADWKRKAIIDKLKKSDNIELTGETARNMGHGLAVYDNGATQRDILFIETDEKKLNEFDPLTEGSKE